MDQGLVDEIKEFLLRAIREHEEEWLAIEAESLLKRIAQAEAARSSR